jgi:hypothetical protein
MMTVLKKIIFVLSLISFFYASLAAQTQGGAFKAPSTPGDTIPVISSADSVLAPSNYRVVKKDFVVSDQVKIATAIMTFVIVVMSFMNNFNPD